MSTIIGERQLAEPPVSAPAPQRRVSTMAIVLFPARAFLALGWIRAAVEKFISQDWWTGDEILTFVAEHQQSTLPFLLPVADSLNSTGAAALALAVLVAEGLIGICLITGRRLRPALWAACALNVSFVMFGAVTPSAFYLVLQMTLLLALAARRAPRSASQTGISVGLWLAVAVAMLPLITTLHPHEVIEDPAIMLATLAGLRAAALTVLAIEAG